MGGCKAKSVRMRKGVRVEEISLTLKKVKSAKKCFILQKIRIR